MPPQKSAFKACLPRSLNREKIAVLAEQRGTFQTQWQD